MNLKNSFTQSFVRVLIVVLMLLLADFGVGSVMKKFYFKQESGDGYLLTYAIDSTEAEILILGSSRAKHSYVPGVFEEILNMTCFNAGRDGTEHVLFNCAQFGVISARYSPDIVIFDMRPEDFIYNANEYDMLSPLMPYYNTHQEIRELIVKRSPFERLKHLSSIYPYNSLFFQIVMGNLEMNKDRKPHENGYIPFRGSKINSSPDTLRIPISPIDSDKITLLKDLIHICKEKSIRLVLIYSPTYDIVEIDGYHKLVNELCDENSIEFLNFSNVHEILINPEYFFDRTHLNDEGARRFSSIVAMELKRILELK